MIEGEALNGILLIEENDGLREDLARTLESLGYQVEVRADLNQLPLSFLESRCVVCLLGQNFYVEWFQRHGDTFPQDRMLWMAGSRAEEDGALFANPNRTLLRKPFSIAELERRLTACRSADAEWTLFGSDPILTTRQPSFQQTLDRARRVAREEVSIVIEGELGSGRRALAEAMHRWSPRHGEALVTLDRGELEIVGRARAAEHLRRTLTQAVGGGLLLIEPADWPGWAQQALVERLRFGSPTPRIWSLSPESIDRSIREGRLDVELAYRLDAVRLTVPPLRERPLDHLNLCTAIARRVARAQGRATPPIDEGQVARWALEGFPGNRLGLERRLRNDLIRSEEGTRSAPTGRAGLGGGSSEVQEDAASFNLKTLERETIVRALTHWKGNRTRASESLGISVRTLRNKIRDLDLR